MDIYALDENFNLVAIGLPYENLQWTRRYYEAGDFQVKLPKHIYDPTWRYIGVTNRPELGMIQQIQLSGEGNVNVLLSGFFAEKWLDDRVCYPRYKGDVSHTETAARNIFTRYKGDLPISLGPANDPLIGDRTQSDFSDDMLGLKLYSILESREASYRVTYDYLANALTFNVWQGKDRTQSQTENSWQTFSTEFGNLVDKKANIDDSGWKNYAIIPVKGDENGIEQDTYYLDLRAEGDPKKEIVMNRRSSKPDDGQSEADFKAEVLEDVREKMKAYEKVETIDVKPASNLGYMVDYDLGDKCDVVLTDIGYQLETRIVEVAEVFKAQGGHEVTIGLGNKRITNLRRATL